MAFGDTVLSGVQRPLDAGHEFFPINDALDAGVGPIWVLDGIAIMVEGFEERSRVFDAPPRVGCRHG